MELDIDNEFEKSKSLLDEIIRPLQWSGVWLPQRTIMSDVKFSVLVTYYAIHLMIMYHDLMMGFGDFQCILVNLMESGVQSIFMLRILVLRFRRHFTTIIISLKEDIVDYNYKDQIERDIHVKFSSKTRHYDKIFMSLGIVSAFSWYFTPLVKYIIAWICNDNITLSHACQMCGDKYLLSSEWNMIIYIYQLPITFFPISYLSSYGLMMMAINHICEHLSILSHRIANLAKHKVMNDTSNNLIGELVEKRIRAVCLTKTFTDGFHLVLLYELIVTTVLMSLSTYDILLNIENVAMLQILSSTCYVISIMLAIYGYCLMGQMLITESENLAAACYECDWYEMPISFQKSLLIFMKYSQSPLQLTAGKFYVYSYSTFTNIVKSSMAYVSMLRAVM